MNVIEQESCEEFTIKIYPDEDAQNPRKDDPLGSMICFHRRYSLGDDHRLTIEEAREIAADPANVVLPLFLYDHSGITMSCSPFSCPWDSGQVGIIYLTREKLIEEFGADTPETREQARKSLEGQVETYDQYLTGDVYGYVIEDEEGENLESCWGFYGSECCLREARASAKYLSESIAEGGTYVI